MPVANLHRSHGALVVHHASGRFCRCRHDSGPTNFPHINPERGKP